MARLEQFISADTVIRNQYTDLFARIVQEEIAFNGLEVRQRMRLERLQDESFFRRSARPRMAACLMRFSRSKACTRPSMLR